MPALLPSELYYCNEATSDDSLLALLIQKPSDLIVFFEYACDDETWSEIHSDFMQKTMEWLTVQTFQDKLLVEFCKRAAKSIQAHYSILHAYIPLNLTFKFQDSSIQINSLLFSAASNFFKDILRRECFEKENLELSFDISPYFFKPIEEFVNTGKIAYLWKYDKEEIMKILRLAASWELHGVVEQCENSLRRYITIENVIDTLLMANQESWPRLKLACIHYINNHEDEFVLSFNEVESLTFEFLQFNDSSLKYFERLKGIITELICSGNLNENGLFTKVITQCPRLHALNLNGSFSFNESFFSIPQSLEVLNLSQCPWLNEQTLKKFAIICPTLRKLILSSNTQLNFIMWGELTKFSHLTSLDLSRCTQINDEDFLIIVKACPRLTELVLDECSNISDKGFFELAKTLSQINELDLSRCLLIDAALVELATRCRYLTSLNLTRCENITEKGVLALLKQALQLKKLNLTRCNIPLAVLEKIQSKIHLIS